MTDSPSTIGPYSVRRRLGAGGMGSVYLAQDTSLNRLVAVKVLHEGIEDEAVRERFTREAHYAGRLRHHNIITIFGFGHDKGQPFIVMEYIPGETLAELIVRKARISMPAKLGLMRDVCGGLGHAHQMGIVHRDVKPANVMVDVDGTAKIVDFGIARRTESNLTRTGTLIGTLNYLSPEQLRGDAIDARSDIFAVGALFYELVTGLKAFPGGVDDGVLGKIMLGEPPPIRTLCPDVPIEIEHCIVRALAKVPDDRFADLGTMATEIERIQHLLDPDGRSAYSRELSALVIKRQIDVDLNAATLVVKTEELTRLADQYVEEAERALRNSNYRGAIEHGERALALNAAAANAVTVIEQARAALRERTQLEGSAPTVPGRRRTTVIAGTVGALVIVAGAAASFWYRTTTGAPSPAVATASNTRPDSATPPPPAPVQPTAQAAAPDPARTPPTAQPVPGNADNLTSQARTLYDGGQRDQALGVLQSAMLLDAINRNATALAQTWLARARDETRAARSAADALGAPVSASREYQDGRSKETDAARSPRPTDSIRLLWTAASSYNAARAAGQPRPAAATTPPTPDVPAATQTQAPAPIPANLAPTTPAPTSAAAATPAAPTATTPPATEPAPTGAATTASPASPPPNAATVIPQGARDALDKYAAAYSRQNLRDIKAIFPTLPKDREDSLKKAFGGGCRAYDVRFGRLDASRVTADSVYVIADTSYTCTPVTGGTKQTVTAQDVFQVKRVGAGWIIASMQLM